MNINTQSDDEITIPHPITEHMPENKTVFTISTIISVITCLTSIVALNQILLSYRIIICLSVICFILLFNAIFLYVKGRELYYQICYNIAMSDSLVKEVKKVKAENEKLKSMINYV